MSQVRPASVLANPHSSCHTSSQSNASERSFRSCKTHTSPRNHLQNLHLRNSEASPLIVMHQHRNSLTGTNSDSVTEFPSPCHSLIYHSTCIVSFWTGCSAFFRQWLGPGFVPRARLRRRTDMLLRLGSSRRVEWSGLAWRQVIASLREGQCRQEEVWRCLEESMKFGKNTVHAMGLKELAGVWHAKKREYLIQK